MNGDSTQTVQSNPKDDGYRGIWWWDTPSDDEYRYVYYSGGFATYTAKHIPLACYCEKANRTFFCYGGTPRDENRLLEMVSCYDHTTGMVPRPTILIDKATQDAHDNPVVMFDGEGHVWVFVSAHGTARPAYIFRGCEPGSVERFDRVLETNFSYPQPWYMPDRGFLFLHTRYLGGRFLYSMTSSDGLTWSEPRELSKIAHGHYQVSWPRGQKVGTAFNFHPEKLPGPPRTNLYYMETSDFGATWTNAAGERLGLPLVDPRNSALVWDYGSEDWQVFVKDVNYDADGNPIVLHLVSRGMGTGPQNDPRIWRTARWTGSDWQILDAFRSDHNYDTGGLHLEGDGTWRIIGPTEPGPQPYNTGGEVAVWTSADSGSSWTKVQDVTRNSTYNHTYVRRPYRAHPDFYAFWADGNAREMSESRLYFCDRSGQTVYRLPTEMSDDWAYPERVRF
ncbi:MAG: BNR-4 repeat-containing protein [Candidatus Latescibacteria bacterium]|nr:BNR-4 repeat-containing protein [Candidatus Latescibacterota bacterium]